MDPVEPAGADPTGDHRPAETTVDELAPADDTVLTFGEFAEGFCVGFRPTVGRSSTQKGHAGILGAGM